MKILQFFRTGDNFSYRKTVGIQWPWYIKEVPFPLKDQKNPQKWKLKIFPRDF